MRFPKLTVSQSAKSKIPETWNAYKPGRNGIQHELERVYVQGERGLLPDGISQGETGRTFSVIGGGEGGTGGEKDLGFEMGKLLGLMESGERGRGQR